MNYDDFFLFLSFFSFLFDLPPNFRGKPADPSRHTGSKSLF
jgi:hypothetical protein